MSEFIKEETRVLQKPERVMLCTLKPDPVDLKQGVAEILKQIPSVRAAHMIGIAFSDTPVHPAIGIDHSGDFDEILAKLNPFIREWCELRISGVDFFDMNGGSLVRQLKAEPPFFKRGLFHRLLNG